MIHSLMYSFDGYTNSTGAWFKLKITGKSRKEPKQSLVELDWIKMRLENE